MKEAGILYIIGTPIGNLDDITKRALDTFELIDVLLCEDTRVTKKMLDRFGIKKPTLSFHEHSDAKKLETVLEKLAEGQSIGLVTDAGTPGVSDPGNWLVQHARERGIGVVPIPGVSALATLISVAGIDMKEFVFKGFPPHKKGRQTFFTEVARSAIPVVYFESPHRVIKNIELLRTLAPQKSMLVGRELTKIFEQIFEGSMDEVSNFFRENPTKVKGEFTLIVF